MNKKSIGLGDTVEKITEATGIKTLVELLFGENCGCEERKDKLNKLFPYATEFLTEEEYLYLKEFGFNQYSLTTDTQRELLKIYNRVFNQKRQPTSCGSCWIGIVNDLHKLYDEHNQ